LPVAEQEDASARVQLRRSFGTRDAAALIVSNVIGVGIFTAPGIVANLVPNPTAMLALWIVGGFLAFAGARSYAELAKICPEAGGEYAYLREAFGPLAGFLSGWVSLIAGFSGAIAASAVALASYLGHYLPRAATTQSIFFLHIPWIVVPVSARSLTAAAIIIVFSVLHICGLGPSRLAQNALALLILAIIVALTLAGFIAGKGQLSHFHSANLPFRPLNWPLALIPVMFTYSGWNAAAYISEESRDPERTVPKAMAIGTLIVIAVYVALNTLYLFALPLNRLRATINVGDAAAQALFGLGNGYITPVFLVALCGAISAMTIAGPRVFFAMARDGAFISSFSRIHPKFNTPARAIALQAAWSVVLVMVGGFEQILIYTGFAIVLSSGVAVIALFVLTHRRGAERPGMGLMLLSAAFVTASFGMVGNAIFEAPKTSMIGLALIAAGIPVFIWSKRTHRRRNALLLQDDKADQKIAIRPC
jgi:basic amino acid/polyamine antiporter, APA family